MVILLSGTPTPESYCQMYHQVYTIPGNPFAEFKNFYRFKSMKILMVTTETDFEYMSRAMEAGADEYLMKPFDKAALRGKLELLGLAAPASIPEAE
jgi:DNA-binding NarL/FixJ family response regulator